MLVQFLALSLGVSSVFASTPVSPAASAAVSDDALILITNLHPATIAQQVNARVQLSAAVGALKSHYASVDVLDSSSESEAAIDLAVQKRKDAAHVDVIALSAAISPPAKSAHVAKLAGVSNLRLVYVGGHALPSVLRDFKNLGATLTISQSDFTDSSSLSTVHFVHAWADGFPAKMAADEAQTYALKFQKVIGTFARAKNAPSLIMEGTNVDRKGGNFEHVSEGGAPEVFFPDGDEETNAVETSAPGQQSTDFKAAAVAALNVLVPAVDVKSQDVSPGAFLDRVQPMLWEELQGVFTSTSSQAPTTETDPQAQEMWADGQFLKFMGAPLQSWAGGKFASILQYLEGVKLIRGEERLEVNLYFTQAFDISIQDEAKAANFSLYGIHIPKTVRISISTEKQTVSLVGLDDKEGVAQDRLFLRVKIPVVSDKIYLRNGSIELTSGKLQAEAGILGDTVGLSASAQIFAAHPKASFDFWKSVQDNDSLFIWPIILFQKEL